MCRSDEASVPATLRDVLGVRSYKLANNATVEWPGGVPVFVARAADLPAPGIRPSGYRGEFVITLTRIAVASVLPITVGATFADGAYRLRVEGIEREDGGLRIFARTSNVRTIFKRSPQPVYYFFLRNRRLSEACEASVFRNRVVLGTRYPKASPFEVSGSEMFFRRVWLEGKEARPDDEWLAEAELVVVRTVADGMLARTLEMTGVEVASD
jgi:hypothetical protein